MYEVINLAHETIFTPFVLETFVFMKIYLFWTFTHYLTCQLYHKFCVPTKWYYSMFTPFYNQTPLCRGLHWFYDTSTTTINSISVSIVTWSTRYIMDLFSYKRKND